MTDAANIVSPVTAAPAPTGASAPSPRPRPPAPSGAAARAEAAPPDAPRTAPQSARVETPRKPLAVDVQKEAGVFVYTLRDPVTDTVLAVIPRAAVEAGRNGRHVDQTA